MISYILRFIILVLIFLFLKRIILSLFSSGKSPGPEKRTGSPRDMDLIKRDQVEKDPVCGMFVAREAAITARKNGETYYFCSEECRSKFLDSPDA